MLLLSFSTDLLAIVCEHVRLVHNFSLNQLLDDVLHRHQANCFIERITVTFIVDAMHKRHVTLAALLEFPEHDIKRDVVVDKVTRILIEFAQRFEGRVVVGIHKCKVFDVQEGHNVDLVTLVN